MAFLSLGVVIVAQLIKTLTKMGGGMPDYQKRRKRKCEETPNFLTVEEEIYLVIL